MQIDVQRTEYQDIEAFRELYRQEANCQIIHDSILRRSLADSYLILVDGRPAGYGGVWNKYDPGRVMEFYVLPRHRARAQDIFRSLVQVSEATQVEAQTNMPLMLTMLYDFATNITAESILFHDAFTTELTCPAATFRRTTPEDGGPFADWGIELGGEIVADGGFLCHYNPPYGDVFMTVVEGARQKGIGSYLVQELKRVCYEAGKKPSTRCKPTNVASRRTLQKAGFLPCGRLLGGEITRNTL
jgi:GNAT superfamily N-acetyltransferase